MPGMGEFAKSSILVPGGSSFTSATRGSGGAACVSAGAGACALAWPRAPSRAMTAITRTLLNIEHSGDRREGIGLSAMPRVHPVRYLTARMMLRVQIFQAFARDVRVDLRGGQIAVAEEHLHHAQIRAVVQQVGC